MRHLRQTLFLTSLLLLALATAGEAQQSRASRNANAQPRISSQPTGSQTPQNPADSVEIPATIALLGSVQRPGIYQAETPSVTLEVLLQSAGGVTSESNGGVRFYRNGQSQAISPIERMLTIPLVNGQIVFVTPRGGMTRSTQSPRQSPYRPVVITGVGETPLILNLGSKSLDVEGLVNLLGQPPEVLGSEQFCASCPQRQWLSRSDMLSPNSIVHFPAETVNHERVRWAMQNGLTFEPPYAVASPRSTPEAQPAPGAVPPVAAPPAASPSEPRPAVLPRQAPATGLVIPGELQSETNAIEIEPARSEAPSREPLRLRQYRDEPDFDLDENASENTPGAGRPPIMMRPEWSTFGEDDEDVDPDRKIERTSAGLDLFEDEGIMLTSGEMAAPLETEPRRLPLFDAPRTTVAQVVDPWLAVGVTLAIACISYLITRLVSREDRRTMEEMVERRSSHPVTASSAVSAAATESPPAPVEEDRRFLQRLIVNQMPLVEEEPTLPPVDHLHGIVIGSRRMVVHDAHEGVEGPHFAVREKSDTRPIERRLRTVLREVTAQTTVPQRTAAEPSTRPVVSPLERALRNVEQGGRG